MFREDQSVMILTSASFTPKSKCIILLWWTKFSTRSCTSTIPRFSPILLTRCFKKWARSDPVLEFWMGFFIASKTTVTTDNNRRGIGWENIFMKLARLRLEIAQVKVHHGIVGSVCGSAMLHEFHFSSSVRFRFKLGKWQRSLGSWTLQSPNKTLKN